MSIEIKIINSGDISKVAPKKSSSWEIFGEMSADHGQENKFSYNPENAIYFTLIASFLCFKSQKRKLAISIQ